MNNITENKLNEQALKERMIFDAVLILSSVEWTQLRIEEKLLEIEQAQINNKFDTLQELHNQILSLLARLEREKINMDKYMIKYRRLVNERKKMLPCSGSKKPVYLRGVPPNARRIN